MDLESRHGLMEQNTLVSGEKIEPTAKEDSFMWMETFMMDFGQMIRPMASEFISM